MKLKKTLALILSLVMLLALGVACNKAPADKDAETKGSEEGTVAADENQTEKEEAENMEADGEAKKIAVFYYQYADTYISTVRASFNEMAEANKQVEILEFDGQNNQATQNDQIDTAISKGVDVLLVNIVDTGAAATVIDKAKAADLPVIFWNREPADAEVYKTYDKSRFVGTKIEEAGILQGQLIAEFWNSGDHDRNGNGVLDYVLLHGGQDNAEAIARSEYSVKSLEEAGIKVNKISEQIANWDTELAKNAMDAWLAKDKDNIDVVIANNDGMAIGAINALNTEGLNNDGMEDKAKYIAVFGVDATDEAKEKIAAGTMVATVKQDNVAMAAGIFALANNAANGKDFLEGTDYQYDDSGIAIRIPYASYTGE